MARSEHYLFRVRPSPWPKTVITLHVQCEWVTDDNNPLRQVLYMRQWNVAIVTKEEGGYSISRTACGATIQGFYLGLAECLNRSRGCTLICSCTRQAAAALKLWELLENGEVTISGRDYRSRKGIPGDLSGMPEDRAGDIVAGEKQVDKDNVQGMQNNMGQGGRNRRRHSSGGSRKTGGIMILNDPPIVMDLRLDGSQYKLIWLDAANYSVDAIGEWGDNPDTSRRLAEWYISAAVALKEAGDCGWQNTAGSQAMHLFRSSYLDTSILSHTHPAASQLEKDALFGGRCQCFRVGKIAGPVHLYDIRSMYPWLCANLSLPVRLCRALERPTMDDLAVLDPALFCIADVAIICDESQYPKRVGDAVHYPVGHYWTCLAGAELCSAMRAGNVRGVRRLAIYESEPALARYASALYGLRCRYDLQHSRNGGSYIKRLMNSVVGKFSQTERTWEDCPNAESAFEWGEWWATGRDGDMTRWRSIAGYVQREQLGGWSHGAVPAITIAITSAGRDRLARIMDAAERQSVVYCDTDAIIVDDYGAERLTLAGWIKPGEWGFLQHVESADECTIYGDKKYTIGGRNRYSGRSIGVGGANGAPVDGASQPWIGWALRHQQRPADWREYHPAIDTVGRYGGERCAGGIVRPMELWEW